MTRPPQSPSAADPAASAASAATSLTRAQADALWARTPEHVFKENRRSKVWRVRDASGRGWIIKEYQHDRLRQWAAWWVGVHPVKTERRRSRQLAADGLPVVPVAATGIARGRGWLITPSAGTSLAMMIERANRDRAAADTGPPAGTANQRDLLHALVRLTADVVDRGWFLRDLRTANCVVDEGPPPRISLIDTGSARRSRSPRHVVRMLGMLARTACMDGAPWRTCLRGLVLASRQIGRAGGARQLAQAIADQPDLWPPPPDARTQPPRAKGCRP